MEWSDSGKESEGGGMRLVHSPGLQLPRIGGRPCMGTVVNPAGSAVCRVVWGHYGLEVWVFRHHLAISYGCPLPYSSFTSLPQ